MAGARSDLRGVREGFPREDGQERVCCLGQGGIAGAGAGAGQGIQGEGEPAAGIGVMPGVGVPEDGGDCRAEFSAAGGVPGGHGGCARWLRACTACGDDGRRVRCAGVLAGDRGLDRGKGSEVPVQAGD